MAIRDLLKGRQAAVAALAAVMILGAGVAIFLQLRDDGSEGSGVYYTTDEGRTLFVDASTRLPPFDKGGKPAYRAHVFECGGKKVVGYLSRYTEEAKKALDEAVAHRGTGKAPPNVRQLAAIGITGIEIKRPGEPNWIPQGDAARATRIRVHRCPDGTTPEEVYP